MVASDSLSTPERIALTVHLALKRGPIEVEAIYAAYRGHLSDFGRVKDFEIARAITILDIMPDVLILDGTIELVGLAGDL